MSSSSNAMNQIKILFETTQVQEIMKTPVITVYEDDDFSEAEEKFIHYGINYVLVVSRQHKFVGLLSQKYIYKTQSPRKILGHEEIDYDPNIIVDGDSFYDKEGLDRYILRNIMSKDPFVMKPEDSVADAVFAMDKKNLGCIPILDQSGKIKGIVTNKEIVSFIVKYIKYPVF